MKSLWMQIYAISTGIHGQALQLISYISYSYIASE